MGWKTGKTDYFQWIKGHRDLVRRYEPVLRFGKVNEDRYENFFPLAAEHYVQCCGLRRTGQAQEDYEQEPGSLALEHLGNAANPEECYLVFAANDPRDGEGSGYELKWLDSNLELSGAGDSLTGRLIVTSDRADEIEEELGDRTEIERTTLSATDPAEGHGRTRTNEAEQPLSYSGLAGVGEELVALEVKGLAHLPPVVYRRALEKYKPYRENWRKYPPVYHWHVCKDGPYRVLQYWFLYAYNDWFNHHEGDWEVVYVLLDDESLRPRYVAYSRHVKFPYVYEPSTAKWEDVPARVRGRGGEKTHPVVYVGCGSHANYLDKGTYSVPPAFLPDFAEGNFLSIGPPHADVNQGWGEPIALADKAWNMNFAGRWGALLRRKVDLGFFAMPLPTVPSTEGPTGPAQKGAKWSHPARWAGLT